MMDDIEILQLSYRKPGVFVEIFNRYHKRFFKAAFSKLGSKDAAEDAVQNAFVKIYRYGDKFLSEGGNFKNWADKILQNCINDEFANGKNFCELNDEILSSVPGENEHLAYESTDFLKSAFSKIDSVSANILEMRYMLGKSFKQIGRTLGISSATARVRAHRARRAFGEVYNELN